jgi:hypothetical protein
VKNPEIVLAILGAGALIGAGLFLGLRSREAGPPPASAPPARAGAPAPAAGPDARAALRDELERRRPALVRACWEPAAAKNPEPRSSEQIWNGTIGPEGTPVAFSVMEVRGASRPEVVACLQDQLASLRLPPRPDSVFVELRFSLP